MDIAAQNKAAKDCLALLNQQIAEIDAELRDLGDKLFVGAITPTLARVRELTLLARREQYERSANAVRASIKHF